jgi:flagellar assembly protein FliH
MSSSSKPGPAWGRFIPREELGDFAAWKPGSLSGGPGAAAAAPPPPAEPGAEEWRARIAAARQQGYQDGYRDGLAALDGFKQSFAAQATAQIGALLAGFDAEFQRLEGEMAAAVARTAVQLARQVLRGEITQQPGLVAAVAAEAVGAVLLSARQVTVQVHPLDLPLVAEGAEETLRARGARLVANPAIGRGGVLVESDVGAIDARIQARWEQAAASLADPEPWDAA